VYFTLRQTLFTPLLPELLSAAPDTLHHKVMSLAYGLDGYIMSSELGTNSTELQIISGKFLLHLALGRVCWHSMDVFAESTSLV
jgi:hypothetical protein